MCNDMGCNSKARADDIRPHFLPNSPSAFLLPKNRKCLMSTDISPGAECGGGRKKKIILCHTEMVNSGGVVGSPGTVLMTGLIRIYKHLGVISSEGQRIDFLCQKREGGLCVS
jgi:hypothetical protein